MKLIRTNNKASNQKTKNNTADPPFKDLSASIKGEIPVDKLDSSNWKMLIVDDEPDVHDLTRIGLKRFTFDGEDLEIISAYSAEQAREILQSNQTFAIAMIDVVMETEEAGLDLVRFIRQELGLLHIRLIIRTGQPGKAPERYVIDNFDIDDYKEKTDLTNLKMYTTIRNLIKSYRDILTIERNRIDLEQKVIERTQDLSRKNQELEDAQSKIKILGGIIPICSYCKEIRDDKGYWNQLEKFISENSEAQFSHAICDKCQKEHFPEVDFKNSHFNSDSEQSS